MTRISRAYAWLGRKLKENNFRSVVLDEIGFPGYRHLTTVGGHSEKKNHWGPDLIMETLLDREGVDVKRLRTWYCLVPPDPDFVYRDVARYFGDDMKGGGKSLRLDWNTAKGWYRKYHLPFHGLPQIMSISDVVTLMDRSKSATFWLNEIFKNKGELFDNISFWQSYYDFIIDVIEGEVDCMFQAYRKEEIRPAKKVLQDRKARAFIIASIYHLLLDHQLNYDFDLEWYEKWYEGDHGIGFSLFNGQYHRKMMKLLKFTGSWMYYDVGFWDKKQQQYVAHHEIDVVNSFYQQFVELRKFIPAAECIKRGYDPNFKVDTYWMRHWIVAQAYGTYVKLPRGEIVRKDDGQTSGNGRTTSGNTGNHKLSTFAMALGFGYKTYEEFNLRNIFEHTGDDEVSKGDRDFQEYLCYTWTEDFGFTIDVEYPESIVGIQYLSTSPRFYKIEHDEYSIVPYVDPAKILASLTDKGGSDDHLVNLQRTLSARVYLRYSEANELIKNAQINYVKMNQKELAALSIPVNDFIWDDEKVDRFYIGHYETEFKCFPRVLQLQEMLGES